MFLAPPKTRPRPFLRFSLASTLALSAALLAGSPAQSQTTSCAGSALRYASSTNILYIQQPVTCTLTELRAFSTKQNIVVLVDPANAVWLLKANLVVQQGGKLILKGVSQGGDVNELRLLSNNNLSAPGYIFVRADWGTITVDTTKITSWDEVAQGPDLDYSPETGRAFIHVRSSLSSDLVTVRPSRLDILNSEVSYLGFSAAESYGLTWKVSTKVIPTNGSNIFDIVDVYGDVINSRIHHNYFGLFSYGAYGMKIKDSEWYNNVSYGIDPHDDSDYLEITGNYSHNNGNHGIICSQRCDHLLIANNTVTDNDGHGIMLHRSVIDSTVENNITTNNTEAGIALFESSQNIVRNNTLTSNRYGIRLSVGSSNNDIYSNDIGMSTQYGIYTYKGSDEPAATNGRPSNNRFRLNNVHDTTDSGIKLGDSDSNTFNSNIFINDGVIRIENSVNTTFVNNSFPANENVRLIGNSTITTSVNFSLQPTPIQITLNSFSTAKYTDANGLIYLPDQTMASILDGSGSTLTFTQATVGSTVYVAPTGLSARALSGNAALTIQDWGSQMKWQLVTTLINQGFSFTITGLTPSQSYEVKRSGNTVGTFTANTSGVITFSDALNDVATYNYECKPN